MIQMDFGFSDEWNKDANSVNLSSMSEIDLRYGATCGDLILVINNVDCSARWGWIPIIDLAAAFHQIRLNFIEKQRGLEIFEFTESEATITLTRDHDSVLIATNYAPCSERVAFEEFDEAISKFCEKAFRESARCFPDLIENPEFLKLRDRTIG